MIVSFLLTILYAFFNLILLIVPAGQNVPTEWTSAIYYIWGYINAFSFIVPVTVLLWALGIALAFHLGVYLWRLFHWISTKIPFVG